MMASPATSPPRVVTSSVKAAQRVGRVRDGRRGRGDFTSKDNFWPSKLPVSLGQSLLSIPDVVLILDTRDGEGVLGSSTVEGWSRSGQRERSHKAEDDDGGVHLDSLS